MDVNVVIKSIAYKKGLIEIIGCFDSDTPKNKIDFYDVFYDGECLNLGEPFYKKPSIKLCKIMVDNFIKNYLGLK